MKISRLAARPAVRTGEGTCGGFRRTTRRRRASLCRLEALEVRACPSGFYDLDVLSLSNGESASLPSLNDAAEVSFLRGPIHSGPWDGTFLSNGTTLTQVTDAGDRGLQLNDRGELLTFTGHDSGGVFWSSLEVLEIASGSSHEIARLSVGGPSTDFQRLANLNSSINNRGEVAFVAQPRIYDEDGNLDFSLPYYLYLSDSFVSAAIPGVEIELDANGDLRRSTVDLADDGQILLTVPGQSGSRIDLYHVDGGITTIASTVTGPWVQLPGAGRISDDGTVIVFTGDRGNGLGVFASVALADGTRELVTIVGEADTSGDGLLDSNDNPYPDLGYNAAGNAIYFDFGLLTGGGSSALPSVATFQNPGGAADAIDPGETFVVMFFTKPSEASRSNPITGQPLLFSAEEGIWTTQVRAQAPIDSSGPAEYLRSSAHKVVQRNDTIAGHSVSRIGSFAEISSAGRDTTGAPRLVNPGDHYVALTALVDNFSQSVVLRASQLDTDGDGLYDHWETEGIDIDQDGTIDLNLPAMGAQVGRKDLFLEVDWLDDDLPAVNPAAFRSFEPDPDALDFLVDVFATAPVTNPDGTAGITVHIDAGAGLSRNMGPVALQGGDRIVEAGTGDHIHVLYYGPEGSVSFPGQVDALGRPIVTRSVEDIKANFFGAADKWARELAFRYVLFGDRHSTPTTSSSGKGELTYFSATSLHTIPGNDFLVTLQGVLDPPTLAVPAGGPAGTPATIPTPPGFAQGQTLVHELGHTLALRHGGIDNVTTLPPNWAGYDPAKSKPDYRSLMNYAYQFGVSPDGTLVRSYSGPGDAVFDDWSAIQLSFNRHYDNLGNSLGIGARGGELPPGADSPEPSIQEFFEVNDSANSLAPTVAIGLPSGFQLTLGEALIVPIMAADDVAVASVIVEFDADGDGTIDPVSERVTALQAALGSYTATFAVTAGAEGTRSVTATATDSDGLSTVATASIMIVPAFTNRPPTFEASGPYTVDEGGSTVLTATAIDPEGDILTFAWDLDGDGLFEAAGSSVTYSAAVLDGSTSRVAHVRVDDGQGHTVIAPVTIMVQNVAPRDVSGGADQTVAEGTLVELNGAYFDPGVADTHTFLWHVDAGNGEVIPDGTGQSFAFVPPAPGVYSVRLTVTDDDGGAGTAIMRVVATASPTVDLNGPTVLNVSRFGFHFAPTVLRLTFNEALDHTQAQDPGQYTLSHPGRDGLFGTRDDRPIRIGSVVYDPTSRSVFLRPLHRIGLTNRVRLVINGSRDPALTDLAGNRLVGNQDGRAGGDYVVTIRGFASGPGQGRTLRPLDLNGDGKVNAEDFQLICKQRRLNPFALIQARRMMAAIR